MPKQRGSSWAGKLLFNWQYTFKGLPWWLSSKGSIAMQDMQEMRVWCQGQEDPLEEGMVTHSGILAVESHRLRSLVGCNSQGHKESSMTEATKHARTHTFKGMDQCWVSEVAWRDHGTTNTARAHCPSSSNCQDNELSKHRNHCQTLHIERSSPEMYISLLYMYYIHGPIYW